jgi:hypothetical protein
LTAHHHSFLAGVAGLGIIFGLLTALLLIPALAGWLAAKRASTGLGLAGLAGLLASFVSSLILALLVQGGWLLGGTSLARPTAVPGCSVFVLAIFASPVSFASGLVGGLVGGAKGWGSAQAAGDLVRVFTAASSEEAMVIGSLFRSASIPCFIHGRELSVPRAHVEDAENVLKSQGEADDGTT